LFESFDGNFFFYSFVLCYKMFICNPLFNKKYLKEIYGKAKYKIDSLKCCHRNKLREVIMDIKTMPSKCSGSVRIPGSKSHTIRALVCAMFADGESVIRNPLISEDTLSAKAMVKSLGAEVTENGNIWRVRGVKKIKGTKVDVGNSGTSLYFGLAAAALSADTVSFDGDDQIRRRTAGPLLSALSSLGVGVTSNDGCAPITIHGPMIGGAAVVHAVTSQYLSALLLSCPLADGDTVIEVPLLNEKPYIDMTLLWLDRCGITYSHDNFKKFYIKGGQKFNTFDFSIPSDFSSASFFLVAGAVCGGSLTLEGLDFDDVQGDRQVAAILRDMGAKVDIAKDSITIQGPLTQGGDFDLNEIPDSLPILSVAACFAPGKTRLYNVEHARIKETDRIAVMCTNLNILGGKVTEHIDGLMIEYSPLKGGDVEGHGDHRVIMSCAVAGCASCNGVTIKGGDAVSVTFPAFIELMNNAGADIAEV
jgi:3-phosphoshikimate 1-carboxyvinyltransferase